MEIAAVVVLYYPDEDLIRNIQTYRPFVKQLYIADNSEQALPAMRQKLSEAFPGCVYLHDGHNAGIAARLNQVARMAREAGIAHLLTMDQDSYFDEATIRNYLSCFMSYPDRDSTAMVGVQYENAHWSEAGCHPVPWTTLITSGSIVNLDLWEKIGGFDERLFIDMVDFEYCYHALSKGYAIILFRNFVLNHRLGSVEYKGGDGTPQASLHSPIRLYYMLRNYLYLKRKYHGRFVQEMKGTRTAVWTRVKNNLLYNKKRWSVFKFVVRAIADVRQGRLGKYHD